jgi:hypothetical protein
MLYNAPFGATDTNASYVDGNPAAGIKGSIPPAKSIEHPQRELVNFITDSGLTPSGTDLHQLGKSVQSGQVTYAADTGTRNNCVITLTPAPPAIIAGMKIAVKMAYAPTSAAVINVNGLGNKSIVTSGGHAITHDAWAAGDIVEMVYDGTSWQAQGLPVAGAPIYLQASRDFYVNSSTGSDLYDGASATVAGGHGPWATLQHAMDYISQFNLNGFNISVHVADGTYANVVLARMSGSGNVAWIGNTSIPANCLIDNGGNGRSALYGVGVGTCHTFTGFKVAASGSYTGVDPICGIACSGPGTAINIGVMDFGACQGAHIGVSQNAQVGLAPVAIKISGGCSGNAQMPGAHIFASAGGQVVNNAGGAPALTISTAVSFPAGFVFASSLAFTAVVYSSITGAGNVTGPKYYAASNAIITTGGAGASYYPGTVAGSTVTGGQYN